MTQTDPIAEARIIIEGFVHDDPSLVVAAGKAWLASNPESKPAAGVTEDLDQIARDAIAFMQAFEEVDWDEGTITRASVAFKEGHRAALAAAAPAAPETIPAEWQPIETAPTDRTPLLLSNGLYVGVGHYDGDETGLEWVDETGDFIEPLPIHWMPLPAAPAVSQPPAAPETIQPGKQLFDLGRGEAFLFNPGGRFHGWVFKRHPDGYYVSHGKVPTIPEPWGPEALAAAPAVSQPPAEEMGNG